MKLQLLIALLTTLGALAAPVAKAGVEHTDTSNLVLSIIEGVSAADSDSVIEKVKRIAKPGVEHTDTSNLVLSVVGAVSGADSTEAINKIKRSITSNNARDVAASPDASIPPIVILAIVAKDEEVEKREAGLGSIIKARAAPAESDATAGTDAEAIPPIVILAIVAKDEEVEKREVGLDNIIKARDTAFEKDSTAETDSTAFPPILILPVLAQDDEVEKREARLINPYIDDVEKADANAVLGE